MSTLQEIERRNPQWRAWLAVVREVLEELDNAAWDAVVPALAPAAALSALEPTPGGAPLLARAAVPLELARLERLRERLAKGADSHAVAGLVPMPLLHACRRRWTAEMPQTWSHGYCPVCGAWPAFAEVCGVERSRYLRCGRCGSAWRVHALWCPYCGNAEHDALASLLVEQGTSRWTIEVCNRCLGYVKTFTRLQPGAPAQTLIDDLASVELDIAAKQRGYVRPDGPGYAPA